MGADEQRITSKTLFIGIDIGSTATKTCVISEGEVRFLDCIPTGYSSVEAAKQAIARVEEAGFSCERRFVAATGYGRIAVPFADKVITEISCHAKGASYLFGKDCVVVDIGGQDTKAIVVKNGKVVKFAMNDKCSAGTGKFLEVMANRMGVSQDELSNLARKGQPTTISSMCTVFAESEVISLIGAGEPRENIAWGVIESVVGKVKPLVPQVQGFPYVLTGGLCENVYLIERLSAQLATPVQTESRARFAGAIGAALAVAEDED